MERNRNPAVHFPPPTLFVLAGLCGSAIESVVPVPLSTLLTLPGQTIIGWAAVTIGSAVLLWGLLTFIKARTAIYPNKAAAALIAHGPYRFSRNPMYVGLTTMTVGVGLLADNVWMLMLLPVALVVLTVFVIQREENYLTDAFGDSYRDYQACVRRWL